MYPPVFEIATQSAAVLAVLGSNPTRLWPFAIAPQKGKPGYGVPYAVHQLIYGAPVNTLSARVSVLAGPSGSTPAGVC